MKTLSHHLEEMIAHRKSLNFSERTLSGDRSNGKLFLRFLYENFQVATADKLRSSHLKAYQKHITTLKNRQGLPIKAVSINCRIKTVVVFLHYLRRNGLAQANLLNHISYVKEPKLLPGSVLTHAQVKKLVRVIDISTMTGRRDRTIIELLYSTGIRAREMTLLTLEDIDLDNAIIKVFGKGRKERIVPIGKTALRHLQTYLLAIRPFMKSAALSRALFLNAIGNPLSQVSVRDMLKRYAQEAKLDINVTCHTFRRSCATEMIRENANIYHVKELLGHESIETLKPYTKLTIFDLKKTHAKCHPREKDE